MIAARLAAQAEELALCVAVFILALVLASWDRTNRRRRAARAAELRARAGTEQQDAAAVVRECWTEPWADWCCERGFLTRGDLHHPTECVRGQS